MSHRRLCTPTAAACVGVVAALCAAVLACCAAVPAAAAVRRGGHVAERHAAGGSDGVLAYISDSDYYSSSGTASIATVDPDGKGRHTLITSVSAVLGLLAFSPTGARLAYFRGTQSAARIEVIDVATGASSSVVKLRTTHAYVNGIAWTSNGRNLIVSTNEVPGTSTTHTYSALWRVPVAGGKAKRLTPYDDAGSPTVAPDGDIVYVVSKTFSSTTLHASSLWVSGPNGGGRRRIFSSSHFVDWPAVSPAGTTVAFSLLQTYSTSHIESIGIDGGSARAITPLVKGRSDVQPSWSPDGAQLAFLSSRSGRHYGANKADELMDAYVMDATGKDVTAVVTLKGDEKGVAALEWGL